MITGHLPYQKMQRSKAAKLLTEGNRPELPNEDISEDLKELLKMYWAQDPNQQCSFDQVIFKMLEKKIVLPCYSKAKEKIYSFYEKCQIKINFSLKCLNAFDMIKNYIGKALQYRFEFLRARPILSSYQ